MKPKLGELLNAQMALNHLAEQPLPIMQAFRLSQLILKMQEPLKAYDQVRVKTLAKYGTLPEGAREYKFEPGQRELFEKEITQLVIADIELDGEKYKLADLGEIKLSAADLLALAWLIE